METSITEKHRKCTVQVISEIISRIKDNLRLLQEILDEINLSVLDVVVDEKFERRHLRRQRGVVYDSDDDTGHDGYDDKTKIVMQNERQ